MARIARFQHALCTLSRPSATLGMAVDCGYADQSHLSREIREMTGMTPRELSLFLCRAAARPDAVADSRRS